MACNSFCLSDKTVIRLKGLPEPGGSCRELVRRLTAVHAVPAGSEGFAAYNSDTFRQTDPADLFQGVGRITGKLPLLSGWTIGHFLLISL